MHHMQRNHHRGGGGCGSASGFPDVSLEALERFRVLPDATELFRDTLYDSAAYPAAGISTLSFFAAPSGQGVGLSGGVKTYSDTNMDLAGQLSQGMGFLIEEIEVEFQPATPFPGNAKDFPAAFGAGQALQLINDVYAFGRSGHLSFSGPNNKIFLINGPLGRFPATKNFVTEASFADATTLAAAQQSRAGIARWEGEPFSLHPCPIWLEPNMKFGINLNWPEGPQALPSGVPARVFVRLVGIRAHLGPQAASRTRRAHLGGHHFGGGHSGHHGHHLQHLR